MSKSSRFLIAPVAAVLMALACGPVGAAVLYDGALGTAPGAQGWISQGLGAPPSQSVASGTYRLDTTGTGVVTFGSGLVSAVPLDTTSGYDLSFSLQVSGETHSSANRAGFSVLAVGADPGKAIELAFWTGHVWAYDYDGGAPDRFVHGTDAAFDTASALQTYTLAVRQQQFTLSSGGSTLLSGALRDYTASGLPPYATPNLLFFGDDSSRGTSVTKLGFVSLSPVPEPASAALWLAGLAVLGARDWRRAGLRV